MVQSSKVSCLRVQGLPTNKIMFGVRQKLGIYAHTLQYSYLNPKKNTQTFAYGFCCECLCKQLDFK